MRVLLALWTLTALLAPPAFAAMPGEQEARDAIAARLAKLQSVVVTYDVQ